MSITEIDNGYAASQPSGTQRDRKGSFLRASFRGNLASSELRRVEQEIDIPTPDRLQSRLPDRKRQVNSNNICRVPTCAELPGETNVTSSVTRAKCIPTT